MKKIIVLSVMMVLCLSYAAFALELANNANCPVLGNPVNGKDFADNEGKLYGVCCADCIAKFEEEPLKYISAMSKDTLAVTAKKASGCAGCGSKGGCK